MMELMSKMMMAASYPCGHVQLVCCTSTSRQQRLNQFSFLQLLPSWLHTCATHALSDSSSCLAVSSFLWPGNVKKLSSASLISSYRKSSVSCNWLGSMHVMLHYCMACQSKSSHVSCRTGRSHFILLIQLSWAVIWLSYRIMAAPVTLYVSSDDDRY